MRSLIIGGGLVLLYAVALSALGCDQPTPRYLVDACKQRELFLACMQSQLSASTTRGDDDGDTVQECKNAAREMARRKVELVTPECDSGDTSY